jgi:hypothetical protein
MKAFTWACALLVTAAATAVAGDLKSGLQTGDSVGAFNVEKVAGAVNDGKNSGDVFCYRCMLGNKPTVMIFSRSADESLAKLVKELDAACAKNSEQKLSSFVNLLGSDATAVKATAKDFAAKAKPQNVAVVVPTDSANGPAGFNISPEAEVTVMIYRDGKVAANHALPKGKLDAKAISAIVADTGKILK